MSNRLSNCDGIACLVCELLIQMKVYPTTHPSPLDNRDIIRKKKNKPSAQMKGLYILTICEKVLHAVLYIVFIMLI